MTAEEEMSNTEGHAIQMEGVDITAKQDGGVMKVFAWGPMLMDV